MARSGHTRRENYEFTDVGGPAPASAFSHAPYLRLEDLDPVVYDGRTLGTALSGSILEFTYKRGASTLSYHRPWLGLPPRKPEAHGS